MLLSYRVIVYSSAVDSEDYFLKEMLPKGQTEVSEKDLTFEKVLHIFAKEKESFLIFMTKVVFCTVELDSSFLNEFKFYFIR